MGHGGGPGRPVRTRPVGWGGMEVRSPLLLPDLPFFIRESWGAGYGGFGGWLFYRSVLAETDIRGWRKHP